MKKVFVIGSGGFSKQVIEIIELTKDKDNKLKLMGIVDDDVNKHGHSILGYEVVGDKILRKIIYPRTPICSYCNCKWKCKEENC